MRNNFRRRDFLIAAGALLAVPRAGAQAPALPAVGYLAIGAPRGTPHLIEAFNRGLGETGYVDGQNVVIEYRWAEGRGDRITEYLAEFVSRNFAAIVATGGSPTWVPAKAATATIPIVFTGGSDPLRLGLIESFGRPGGNATGVTTNSTGLSAKRLQLLREMVPAATTIALLVNYPSGGMTDEPMKELLAAARGIGQGIQVVNVRSERDFSSAFADMAKKRVRAVLVGSQPFLFSRHKELAELAAKHAIPACYAFSEYVDAGGLMSYGVDLSEVFRQAGVYVGRILKGSKPENLPVLQPTAFELRINAKTAKALRLRIPQALLMRADRVVE